MKKSICITAALFTLLGPTIASSCALHTSSITGLQVSHPASITVSVATRNALDAGTVSELGKPGTEDKHQKLEQIENAFHAFGEIAAEQQSLGENFTVYLTESRLWTRFTESDNGWQVKHHVTGPVNGETVLVISDTALRGLFDDTLSIDRAKELQLVVADGTKGSTATALQSFQQILGAYLQTEISDHATVASAHHKHPNQS